MDNNTAVLDRAETVINQEKLKRKEALEVLEKIAYADHFNPFKVMRNGDHEIRHSNTLAWLFDKKDNHGLGAAFAEAFFSEIFKEVDWKDKFSGDVTIETEVGAKADIFDKYKKEHKSEFDENERLEKEKKGHDKRKVSEDTGDTPSDKQGVKKDKKKRSDNKKKIDILIKGSDFTITIENKYGSGEHDWQCQRYRHYIEDTYNENKGYTKNYFVFLDIEEPDNWFIGKDANIKNLKYKGYELITYDRVRDILTKMTDGKDENKEAITYIKKYIEVLNETYGVFDPEIAAIFNENLKYGEEIHELRGISTKQKLGRDMFERYSKDLQVQKNEPLVKNVLKELVKKEFQKEDVVRNYGEKMNENLIQYHFGAAVVTNPYAYKLAIGNYEEKGEDAKKEKTEKFSGYEKLTKASSFINEIDYIAKYGYYSIALYFGSTTERTKEWCKAAYKDFDKFCADLENLKADGWRIWIEFNILNGWGQGSGATKKNLKFEYDPENIKRLKTYWSESYINATIGRVEKQALIKAGDGSADESSPILKMIKELYPDINGESSEEYIEVKEVIEDYFAGQKKNIKDIKKSEDQEDKKKAEEKQEKGSGVMTFRWTLALEYKINEKPVATEDDRRKIEPELAGIFYEKTKDGLEIFCIGKDFVSSVFNEPAQE